MSTSFPRLVILGLAAFCFAAAILPTAFGAMSDQELEAIVAKRLKGDRTGANLAVAYIEGSHVARAFVAAGEGPDALRIGPNTAFEIGSVSKTMTAALLADLILRGDVSLDDPLSDWLPEGTRVPDFQGHPILLRHIVTHTSGLPALPSQMPLNDLSNPYAQLTDENLLASLEEVQLSAPPGTQYAYSNFAGMLLSYALTRHANTDFETLVRERLFVPLGMNGAYVGERPESVRAAVGHRHYDTKSTAAWVFPKNLAGVGGVRATLDDMVRYIQEQLDSLEEGMGPALRLTQERLHEGRISFGMHWMQRSAGELSLNYHGGETGGFSAFVAFDREARRGVVALSDTAWGSLGGLGNFTVHLLAPEVVPLDAPRVLMTPSQELLNALAGEYLLGGMLPMSLTAREGVLYVQAQGQPEYEMGYDSEGDFFTLGFDAVLSPNEAGGVHSFTWTQGGGTILATRVDIDLGAPEPALSEAELAAYVGKYPLMPGFILIIRAKDGQLEAQATGQGAFRLDHSGNDRFSASAFGVEIQFNRNAKGEVQTLTLYQGGQSLSGKRE